MELFEKPKRKPGINLTPLIDILFILIIFFVVSSKISSESGVDMQLPESKQGKPTVISEPVLSMDKQGIIRVEDSVVALDELRTFLSALQKKRTTKTLILNIDQRVEHGVVIRIMDDAKNSGFQKIMFGTQPSQK